MTIRLQAHTNTGIVREDRVILDFEQIEFENVTMTPYFSPAFGMSANIAFAINRGATVKAELYEGHWELRTPDFNFETFLVTATPVRTLEQTCTSGGSYSFDWDGKDSANPPALVPQGCYIVRLSASHSNPTVIGKFDSEYATQIGSPDPRILGYAGFSNISVVPPFFNPAAGETLKVTYTSSRTAFILAQAFNQSSARVGDFVYNEVRLAGTNLDEWDGRYGTGIPNSFVPNGTTGELVPASTYDVFLLGVAVPENSIVVDNQFKVNLAPPDPYRLMGLYSRITSMTYTLSYEATVRIQIRDPNNQVFHTLRRHEDGMLSAGAHTFEWDGRQSIYGPDGTIIQEGPSVQVEGIYTVEIQAISQTANATTAETKTTVQVLK